MKFLDMEEKNLLDVLRYLAISDLISVAQTNRLLKKCADLTILSCYESFIDKIKITHPNDVFFRHFGHLARKIVVQCSAIKRTDWNDKKLHILPVIANQCHNNLQSLRLEYVSENLLTLKKKDQDIVRTLFTSINVLSILDCCLIGWEKVMKSAQTKLETISLSFVKTDLCEEYVRKYHGLKSLSLSPMFPKQLLDLNQSIETLVLHTDDISNTKLKAICRMPNLKNISIFFVDPNQGGNCHAKSISTNISPVANIPNLHYLYIYSNIFNPTEGSGSTFMALQHHKKLSELHFFCTIKHTETIRFEKKPFPKLKELSINADFPFMSEISRFETLIDIYIMETATYSLNLSDFQRCDLIITKTPKLRRLIFDVTKDINEVCRDSLVQMSQSRTSRSKLLILVQNFNNNIVKALMYPNTVLMFSVSQPTVPKEEFVFKHSDGSAFDRAKLLAEKGEYVATNYTDFSIGMNSIGKMFD